MAALKFKGIDVEFSDGIIRTVPPLTLRTMQALEARLTSYKGGADPESVALVQDAVHASLVRNYPDLTTDDLLDLMDIANMPRIMSAVMGVSLLVERPASGEAVAGTDSVGLS